MMDRIKSAHKVIALLLVVLLVLGTAPAVLAADDSNVPTTGIVYQGRSMAERWLHNDVDITYTDTDMFCNFKGVMPGDTLEQPFIIKNESRNRIRVYMEILPHGEDNPLSGKVAGQTTTAQMITFLDQLSMKVTAGEEETVLFAIVPEQDTQNQDTREEDLLQQDMQEEDPQEQAVNLGQYYGKQSLGVLPAGQAAVLNVVLDVPIELNDTFAQAIGEVDFRFTIEEIPSGGGTPPKDPEDPADPADPAEPDDPIIIPGEPVEDVEDPEEPIDAPKTGDSTNILTPVLLMLIGAMGIVLLRKRETKR